MNVFYSNTNTVTVNREAFMKMLEQTNLIGEYPNHSGTTFSWKDSEIRQKVMRIFDQCVINNTDSGIMSNRNW